MPPGLLLAADIRGPWRVRAYVVWLLVRYALHLLNPRKTGSRLFIVAHPAPATPPAPAPAPAGEFTA